MKKKKNHYIAYLVLCLTFSALILSCGNRRHEQNNTDKLKKKNDKELIQALFSQDEVSYNFFTVRIGVDLESKTQNTSFSCYVKMRVDSAFSGTIKSFQVVAFTYKIDQDSIIFTNKLDKCYFAENLTYVSSLFGTNVEYDFFQDLILGLPIGLDEEVKYQQINSKDSYILSSHKKRDFRRLENDRLNTDDDVMLIQYHLAPESLEVSEINVQIPSDTAEIKVKYLERKEVDDNRVPEETTIEITHPRDTIFVKLNYGTVKLNEPKKIGIRIPDSYVPCP